MILIVKELPLHSKNKKYFWNAEDILGHLLVLSPGSMIKVNGKQQYNTGRTANGPHPSK